MMRAFPVLFAIGLSTSFASAATMDIQLINFGAAAGGTNNFSTVAPTSLSAAAFASATITRTTSTLPTLQYTVAGLDLTEVGGPSSATINFQLDFSVTGGTAAFTGGGALAINGNGTNRINDVEVATITTSQTGSTTYAQLGGIRQMNLNNYDTGDVVDIDFIANNTTPTTITKTNGGAGPNDGGGFQFLTGANNGTSQVSVTAVNSTGVSPTDSPGVYWNRVDVRFDVPVVIPEPSVGLLGAISGLALLLHRRR